jgi:hypothetical protein
VYTCRLLKKYDIFDYNASGSILPAEPVVSPPTLSSPKHHQLVKVL